MKHLIVVFIIVLSFISCSEQDNLTAEQIIEKSIQNYGGEAVFNSDIKFSFRDKNYRALYQNNTYQLERSYNDSSNIIKDILTNNNFTRTINDSVVNLSQEWIDKYSNSINSVIYFFRVPFHLNDEAVNKELIGTSSINDINYYKIKVWFNQAGGGEDFSDVFVYWINQNNYNVDYFAYSYKTSGGGKRFREMINPRRVNKLLVTDYINYEPKDTSIAIENFDNYFEQGGMKELSRIENKDVKVVYH